MNFFHPLLQSLQLLRFNLNSENKTTTHNLFKEAIKQEEPDPVQTAQMTDDYLLQMMTQQELLKRQLVENMTNYVPTEPIKPINKKISKKSNTCGHADKEHYAKGMCNNCYHRFGRNKQPWLCSHKKLYACGLCQNCYINQYNKKRRTEGQDSQDPVV